MMLADPVFGQLRSPDGVHWHGKVRRRITKNSTATSIATPMSIAFVAIVAIVAFVATVGNIVSR